MEPEHPEAAPGRRRTGARRRGWVIAAVVVLAVVAFCLAWVGVRTALAVGELRAAEPLATEAARALLDGDTDAATDALGSLQAGTANAAALTSDPVFLAVETIPALGPNLEAIRRSATALDSVVTDGLAPLAPFASGLSPSALAPVDGAVDLAPFEAIAPSLAESDGVVASAARDIEALDTGALLPPVAEAVDRLGGLLSEAREAVSAGSRATALLPAMLGSDEDRRYVLMFQNNAEVRASGGIPGALALVSTSGGAFSLDGQTTANDFPLFDDPVLELDEPSRNLFGTLLGEKMQNVGEIPDFGTTGPLVAEMWERRFGVPVDGVIAVDPVTVGYLLSATGPITLPTGDVIDADSAVDFLLSGVYAKYQDTEIQDLVFAATARAVFDELSGGIDDPGALVDGLARASVERRILIWNARPSERAILAGTSFAGTLPASDTGGSTIGVFFNDATGAKMGYYLDAAITAGVVGCTDAARTISATVTLTSSAPSDAATSLPAYVTAAGAYGVEAGHVRTRVLVYGPVGATATSVSVDGEDAGAQVDDQFDRPVVQLLVDLAPGATATVDVTFDDAFDETAGDGSEESVRAGRQVVVQSTPLIRQTPVDIASPECGSPR
ncbi:MAG: hypothetical protein RI885_2600 [Actinomycetota bacterium]